MEAPAVDLPYFYGDITREDAEVILWDRDCIEGMYLLRSSQNKDAKYVLSLCSDKRVHHYRIKQNVDGLLYVHGVELKKYANLPQLVGDIDGLICKPSIACNKALNKLKPGHYYRLSSEEIQRAIEDKAKEWGIEGALLQSNQMQDLHSVVINTLHESQPWFHGKISRAVAEERLIRDRHEDGKFLIRERDDCRSYALCFSHEGELKHYKIDVISTGEMRIKDGPRFENLLELVSHYSVLNDGLWCTLKEPCPRSQFESTVSNHVNTANHQVPVIIQKPSLEPAKDIASRPPLELPQQNEHIGSPNGVMPSNNLMHAESADTNKLSHKLKPSFVKVLPDLNLLKLKKAAQSKNGGISPPMSSPSLSPTSPLTPTTPTALKSPLSPKSQSYFLANLSNDVVTNSDGAKNNEGQSERKEGSAACEPSNVAKKVKRRAPIPLPRKDLVTKQAEEQQIAKPQEVPVPKPRKDVAAKAQESVNLPSTRPNQMVAGPGAGMSSVIKQLQQQLSVTETEMLNAEPPCAIAPPSPLPIIESQVPVQKPANTQEFTEPIYQEIDPDYEASASNDDLQSSNPPSDEGYERIDENEEQPKGVENNVSSDAQQLTNGHKNVTGLCRKPTWTREESEKHFRTVQRIRKNPMTINAKNIVLKEKMGTGNFGDVYKAHFKSDRVEVPFAVKMLKSTVPSAKADILREAKFMTGLDHPNIVRLIGICESETFMLVMELAPLGPLNMYLKTNASFVPITDVIQLLYQIACGMEYLEKEMFVHRDLAARNVLLVNENFAKISDFGMSRVVGLDKDYYQMKNLEGKLPLKWYAPECIQYCKFSSKTDVWSYGITMWEAMSYGEKPYMGMAGPDLWKMLMDGRRLEQPRNCPDYVYSVMLKCWKFSADERPTFKELTALLHDCMPHAGTCD